ncbi:hypothetical protein FAY30_26030 (plasmid) [Bacillus sp. S3]|uniref:hypothetical protein n=1 Tax=Bacillus sp. S3 TaxID=486398 RepID=UPI0011881E69|nr:hypothetical protein [Bacillus sp. S3]QCJ45414.1 hypothetical protein FAY30_26030 [Bacillus sp. S3]
MQIYCSYTSDTEPKEIVKRLIDIFWSDIYNVQVIEETLKAATKLTIPQSIQKFIERMDCLVKAEKKISPLYVIEPYGEALEQLDPIYYSKKRRIFYQEDIEF